MNLRTFKRWMNVLMGLICAVGTLASYAQSESEPTFQWYLDRIYGNGELSALYDSPEQYMDRANAFYGAQFNSCMADTTDSATNICPLSIINEYGPSSNNYLWINGYPEYYQFYGVTRLQGKFRDISQSISYSGPLLQLSLSCPRGQLIRKEVAGAPSNQLWFVCSNLNTQLPPDLAPSCRADGANTGQPITPSTGEKQLYETDWIDSGAHSLSVQRIWRSQVSSTVSLFGNGNSSYWHSSFAHSAKFSGDQLQVTLTLGGGNVRSFTRISVSSAWQSSGAANEQFAAVALPSGQAAWRYTSGGSESMYTFDVNGKILTHALRNGNTTSYSYNASNQLTQITNAFNRSLNLAYNSGGQLAQITTPDNQTIRYEYDSATRLSVVRFADNSSKQYLYENPSFPQLITGVVDENGARLSTYTYDAQARAIETTKAAGADWYQVFYPTNTSAGSSTSTVTTTARISDPLGTLRSYSYATSLSKLAVTGADKPSGQGLADAATRVQNSFGLIDTETDFLGGVTEYKWDTDRRLLTQITRAKYNHASQSTSIQWHASLRLPTRVSEYGKTTDYTYDALGNIITQTETDSTGEASSGLKRIWTFTHTPQGLPASMTDPLGKVWSYTYDAAGNKTSITNPLGHIHQFSHDGAGRVTSETAPNGLVTSYAYDARGRLTQIKRGSNLSSSQQQISNFTYRLSGQIASAALPNGLMINYQYDSAQRLIGASDSRGNSIAYVLDGMGNRTQETIKDASGRIAYATSRVINALNRVSSLSGGTSPAQQTSAFQYDLNGELYRSTDPLGHSTVQSLDALRRPSRTTLPDGSVASASYNQLNQLTYAVDPRGIQTSYSYNAWGQIVRESSPDTGQTNYWYDAAGNLVTLFDAKGQTTRYSYDAIGRLTKILLSDGKVQNFVYDNNGSYTLSNSGSQTGYLRSFSDTSGNTIFERDALGQITRKIQTTLDNPSAPTTLITRYAYTQAGDIAQIGYPSGLNVFYQRNQSGQITSIDTQRPRTSLLRAPATTQLVSGLQYTALNQPKSWSFNCISGNLYAPAIAANCDGAARVFDADGRMTGNEFASYTYDGASRITGITQNLWAERSVIAGSSTNSVSVERYPVPLSWTIQYDNRSRVTGFNRAGSEQTYTYDANSNRLSSVFKKISDTDIDGTFEATDRTQTTRQNTNIASNSNKLNGFTQSILTQANNPRGVYRTVSHVTSAVNYALDANGNLTSDGLRAFQYGADNRLSEVDISLNGEAAKVTYLTNALGQRTFKSEPRTAQTLPNETTLGTTFTDWLKKNFQWLYETAQSNATVGTAYSYADQANGQGLPSWALLGEYGNGGANSTGRTEYIWLPVEEGSGGGAGSAIPIAMFKNNRYWNIHSDHLGTPRVITDDSAKIVWQWSHSAFGDNKPTGILQATSNANNAVVSVQGNGNTSTATLLQATSPIAFNLRFPGQYFDSETGQFYNYYRNYQATQGRYTQNDPIGLAGGMNRFGYVNANPLIYYDPEGLLDLPSLPQGVVDFSAGMGDTLLFGQGQKIRDLMGIDGGIDQCSDAYDSGEWAGVAASVATGFAGGVRAAGTKGAGKEFSHWVPRRMLPENLRDVKTIFNGNYVTPQRHYYHDPYRYPRGWRDLGEKWGSARQQMDRVPNVYKGAAAGAAYGAGGSTAAGCTCKR